MPKKHRKSNKGKIIGGFLGAIVLIGIIGFTLVKFDFIDLDILDGIFNKGDDLSKEVYCKEVSEENVKYDDGILYANNQVSLIANEGVKKREIKKLAKQYGAEIVGYIEFTGDYQLEFSEEKSYDELNSIVSELESDPNVESASLYRVSKVNSTVSNEILKPRYPQNDDWGGSNWNESNPKGNNWGVEAVKAPSAWAFEKEMSEVKIGLIDTNVDSEHEDLKFKKVWHSESVKDSDHGTEVAGIMGAMFDGNKNNTKTGVTGMCPKPILYAASYKGVAEYVGNMNIKCNLSRLILSGVKVINCSFADEQFTIAASVNKQNENVINTLASSKKEFTEFLNKFKEYDFLIVKGAGNENLYYYRLVEQSDEHPYGIELYDPQKHSDISEFTKCENIDTQNDMICNITDKELEDKILVVGSCGKPSWGKYKLSKFSATGDRVDVIAPGEYIYTTEPNSSYTKKGDLKASRGTSLSTPYVSGLAGMIYGINNNLSASQVKEIIINTATTDVKNTDKNMINAGMAVELAKQYKGEGKDAYNQKGAFLCSVIDKYKYEEIDKSNKEEFRESLFEANIAEVSITLTNKETNNVIVLKSNSLGDASCLVDPGTYDILFEKDGYQSGKLENVEIKNGETVYKQVLMSKLSKVTGKVVNKNGNSLEGVTITFRNSNKDISIETNSDGSFSKDLKYGTYTLVISKKGYETKQINVEVNDSQKDLGQITLEKEELASIDNNYLGQWSYEDSGKYVDLQIDSLDKNNISFSISSVRKFNLTIAESMEDTLNATLDGNKINFTCKDGWDNSIKGTIEFKGENVYLQCDVLEYGSTARWSIGTDKIKMEK